MLASTELVEFPHYILEVFSECSEQDGEFSFLLFQENKGSEKRWDQVEFALAEHMH